MQFETGGYQIGDAVLMLVEVSEVKTVPHDPPTRYVVVDGSMMMFVARGMMRVGHPVVPVVEPLRDAIAVSTDIVGQTCVYDSVAENIRLPDLARGDLLAFLQQGAYCETESTQFNGFPRPEVVLLHEGSASIVKRRETIADVRAARRPAARAVDTRLMLEPEVAARIVAQVDELVDELVRPCRPRCRSPASRRATRARTTPRSSAARGASRVSSADVVPPRRRRGRSVRARAGTRERGRRIAGSGGGRSLIFNGHVDVVPPGDAAWRGGEPWSGARRGRSHLGPRRPAT